MDLSLINIALCIGAPFILAIVLTGGETRRFIVFLVLGFACCAVAGMANDYIQASSGVREEFIYSSYYGPVVEEVIKMMPVLVYCLIFKPNRKDSIMSGMSVGIGFGAIENVYYIISHVSKVSSIQWIVARGFATALMHALCTAVVAYMLEIAYRRKKLYLPGTVAALALAITYHSVYNILVKTDYKDIVLFMPIVTYLVMLIYLGRENKKKNPREESYEKE